MLTWSKKFETKIELVDSQHKHLFELLGVLAHHFEQGNPDEDTVDEILKELTEYADKHFTEEEALMEKGHLDARHLSIHRMEHKSFIYDVQSMRSHSSEREEIVNISERLVGFIISWLTYHILGMDMAMAAQLRAIEQGATPTQAYEAHRIALHDVATTRLLLDAVLDLWRESTKRCRRLEEFLAHRR